MWFEFSILFLFGSFNANPPAFLEKIKFFFFNHKQQNFVLLLKYIIYHSLFESTVMLK